MLHENESNRDHKLNYAPEVESAGDRGLGHFAVDGYIKLVPLQVETPQRDRVDSYRTELENYQDNNEGALDRNVFIIPVPQAYDQYTEARDSEVMRVYLDELEDEAKSYIIDRDGEWDNNKDIPFSHKLDLSIPRVRQFYEETPGVEDWRNKLVPTALALEPAYRPDLDEFHGVHFSEHMQNILATCADGRGIRERARVTRDVFIDLFQSAHEKGQSLRMMSLGCGTTEPLMELVQYGRNIGMEEDPELYLLDIDQKALDYAEKNAERLGVETAHVIRENILRPNGLTSSKKIDLEPGSVDIVEATGVSEYLDQKKSNVLLKNMYEMLKPGGRLVIGNMLKDRPEKIFFEEYLQWPGVKQRSVAEVVELFDNAGIKCDIDVYCTAEGVYAVYVAQKPLLDKQ